MKIVKPTKLPADNITYQAKIDGRKCEVSTHTSADPKHWLVDKIACKG
jgi:hypothetical protein